MISKVVFHNFANSIIPWAKDIEFFQKNKSLEFKPGINIIYGRNGSGKSTLLTCMAKMLHCFQGGRSAVSQNSIHELFPISRLVFDKTVKNPILDGVEIIFDGTSVRYFSPLKNYGMTYGEMDQDFIKLFAASLNAKQLSACQQTIFWFNQILSEKLDKNIEYLMNKNSVNDIWVKQIEACEKYLKGKIPQGQPTTLIDEGEKGLDLVNAKQFWDMVAKTNKAQLILASHSPFCLSIKNANYIEMNEGYLEECRKTLKN